MTSMPARKQHSTKRVPVSCCTRPEGKEAKARTCVGLPPEDVHPLHAHCGERNRPAVGSRWFQRSVRVRSSASVKGASQTPGLNLATAVPASALHTMSPQ